MECKVLGTLSSAGSEEHCNVKNGYLMLPGSKTRRPDTDRPPFPGLLGEIAE